MAPTQVIMYRNHIQLKEFIKSSFHTQHPHNTIITTRFLYSFSKFHCICVAETLYIAVTDYEIIHQEPLLLTWNNFHPTMAVFFSKVNIWNVNCARAIALIFYSRPMFLWKCRSFRNSECLDLRGTPLKCGMKLLIHSQTSMTGWLKFRNGQVISSYTL